MKALKIIGLFIVGLFFLLTTLGLLNAALALVQNMNDSYVLGAFMGRLITELVLLAILIRLVKSLRQPAK